VAAATANTRPLLFGEGRGVLDDGFRNGMTGTMPDRTGSGMVLGMLVDRDITRAVNDGTIGIDPFHPDHVQPASYDLTLAADFLVARRSVTTINLADIPDNIMEPVHLDDVGAVRPPPGRVRARIDRSRRSPFRET
jgi:hypothetical protein